MNAPKTIAYCARPVRAGRRFDCINQTMKSEADGYARIVKDANIRINP